MTDDPKNPGKMWYEELFDRPIEKLSKELLLLELTKRIQHGDVRRADIEPLLAECIEYHEREISVLDWGDIRNSVLAELGEWREEGWVEQLTIALEQVKADALRLNPRLKLPIVVQIKQKLGGLRVYATSDSTPSLVQDIESYVL